MVHRIARDRRNPPFESRFFQRVEERTVGVPGGQAAEDPLCPVQGQRLQKCRVFTIAKPDRKTGFAKRSNDFRVEVYAQDLRVSAAQLGQQAPSLPPQADDDHLDRLMVAGLPLDGLFPDGVLAFKPAQPGRQPFEQDV